MIADEAIREACLHLVGFKKVTIASRDKMVGAMSSSRRELLSSELQRPAGLPSATLHGVVYIVVDCFTAIYCWPALSLFRLLIFLLVFPTFQFQR